MKIFRKTKGFLICYALILIIVWRLISYYGNTTIQVEEIQKPVASWLNKCPIPDFKTSVRYAKDNILLTNLKCPISSDLVSVDNGSLKIRNSNLKCTFQCIQWNTDFSYKLTEKQSLTDSQLVPCPYLSVNCRDKVDGEEHSQLVLTGIRNDTIVKESIAILNGSNQRRDVLILGIDSMSFMAYKHYLPQTFSVLHKELNGISFSKFNTLGDGTTVNLQGLLTGTKDTETYESRRRIEGAKPVDNYNWIWKQYKKHGYLTQYYEEMTDYGTFQYRLLGFENQPTDIYLRTMLLYAERNKISKNYCLGNKPQHLELLRFYREVVSTNLEVPNFSFIYYSLASHDDNKYSSYLDGDIAHFLKDIRHQNPGLVIILYSDHGHRFSSRLSMQGKYEERLPFLGISLPDDLKHLRSILKSNSDVLISGLDVHATLEDLLGIYKPSIRGRHMSLLRSLPRDRTCADIESAAHWCACLNWKEISNPNLDKRFVKLADAVTAEIGNFTLLERDLCAELKFKTIVSLFQMDASEQVLKFKQSADVDGFVPDLSDRTEQTQLWFRMVLATIPGDSIFEVTVGIKSENLNADSNIEIDRLLPHDVSRINRYAPWIKCLYKIGARKSMVSDVRKFCICKDTL